MVAALRGAVGLPWQRVLGAGGAIKLRGDYAFEQRFRLEAEGVTFRGRKVDMKLHEHKFAKARKRRAKSSAGILPAVPRASRPRRGEHAGKPRIGKARPDADARRPPPSAG